MNECFISRYWCIIFFVENDFLRIHQPQISNHVYIIAVRKFLIMQLFLSFRCNEGHLASPSSIPVANRSIDQLCSSWRTANRSLRRTVLRCFGRARKEHRQVAGDGAASPAAQIVAAAAGGGWHCRARFRREIGSGRLVGDRRGSRSIRFRRVRDRSDIRLFCVTVLRSQILTPFFLIG